MDRHKVVLLINREVPTAFGAEEVPHKISQLGESILRCVQTTTPSRTLSSLAKEGNP